MAYESFEDPYIASIMNENFVNIKVDREERPDVDQLYMTFVEVVKFTKLLVYLENLGMFYFVNV